MLDFLFLNTRLIAIKRSAEICDANLISGEGKDGRYYSPNQINAALRNREMNRAWFIRNIAKIKRKFPREKYEKLASDLGISSNDLATIEWEFGIIS